MRNNRYDRREQAMSSTAEVYQLAFWLCVTLLLALMAGKAVMVGWPSEIGRSDWADAALPVLILLAAVGAWVSRRLERAHHLVWERHQVLAEQGGHYCTLQAASLLADLDLDGPVERHYAELDNRLRWFGRKGRLVLETAIMAERYALAWQQTSLPAQAAETETRLRLLEGYWASKH